MIYGMLGEIERYAAALPHFGTVREFLARDLSSLPDGKIVLDGENVFASISTYMTKPLEGARFESHDRYIDIQLVLEGEESCGVAPGLGEAGLLVPYDAARDFRLLAQPPRFSSVELRKGFFLVFFPEDPHMPGIAIGEPVQTRKCVVKIRL